MKEDYYEKEIEKIGKFLQAIISYILKRENAEQKSSEEAKSELKLNHEIDLDHLYESSSEDFVKKLSENPGFNHMNMEYMADLISLIADSENDSIRQQEYYAKALSIYQYIERKKREYDQERIRKMEVLKGKLNIINN